MRSAHHSKEDDCELHEAYLPLGGPALDNLPEPLNDLIRRVAVRLVLLITSFQLSFGGYSLSSVVGVLLPVVDIDLGHTTDEQLQLSLVKHIDELLRDKLVETRHESVKLLRYSSGDSVLSNEASTSALIPVQVNSAGLTRHNPSCCAR